MRKITARKVWAMFSGRTNSKGRVSVCIVASNTYTGPTYLVQLVAEVYRVDIIAL